ncbi:Imm21 family immunity protein [Streptomyces pseudogriseolus]|uniref:Imm21 family immunity protein n=1 Tax=Streptomyces pseudogriseolus TaxID=36817 RepID=UPI003FA24EDB
MDASVDTDRCDRAGVVWVRSMGGPLIVVPESSVTAWGGCTEDGSVLGDADGRDDYDRACEVEDWAGVIAVGAGAATVLVLADEPAKTCFLPEKLLFVRWLAADSEAVLFAAAEAVLADPDTAWEDGGLWVTDGPAVLMDSAEAGADLGVEYPDGGGAGPGSSAAPGRSVEGACGPSDRRVPMGGCGAACCRGRPPLTFDGTGHPLGALVVAAHPTVESNV